MFYDLRIRILNSIKSQQVMLILYWYRFKITAKQSKQMYTINFHKKEMCMYFSSYFLWYKASSCLFTVYFFDNYQQIFHSGYPEFQMDSIPTLINIHKL